MPEPTVYSSEPALASPGRFLAAAAADLRVAPAAAWQIWRRGLQGRLRQSRLGVAWLLVPPAALALTWVYLRHARVVDFEGAGTSYLVYVLSGTLLWQTFLDALQAPLGRLSEARALLSRTRLPHEAWLCAGLLDVLFAFLVRAVVIGFALGVAGARPGVSVLLAPVGVAALVVLGFAIGLVLAPLGLLFDDVRQGLLAAVVLWFFLTPVVYPPPTGTGAWAAIELNPVTPLLVTTRGWATGATGAAPGRSAAVLAVALVLLGVGWLAYRLARPHVVARL